MNFEVFLGYENSAHEVLSNNRSKFAVVWSKFNCKQHIAAMNLVCFFFAGGTIGDNV